MAVTSFIGRIAKRAKAIRKQNPKMEWQTAIKKASIELRGNVAKKKVGSTLLLNKGESARKKPSRVYLVKRTKTGRYSGTKKISGMPIIGRVKSRKKTTVNSTLARAKKMLLADIGNLEARKFSARLKRDKKKIAKKIAEKKSLFRKI